MQFNKDKVLNLLEYLGVRSKSYSHSTSPVDYDPSDPLKYFLNQKSRASYNGPYDDTGIPLFQSQGKLVHFPIFITLYGLGHVELYRTTNNENNLSKSIGVANWLCDYQQNSGVWLTNIKVKKFGLHNPWPSAMGQGLAISMLTRVFQITKNEKYLDKAKKAIQPYQKTYDKGGVAGYIGNLVIYDEYPSSLQCHVLNGFIFALWGLFDISRISGDETARRLYEEGLHTLNKILPMYDTGYWSLYHLAGGIKNPATIPYHRLHVNQLNALYLMTNDSIYKEFADRWQEYLQSRFSALMSLPMKLLWIAANEIISPRALTSV